MKENILIVDDIKDEMDYFTGGFKQIPGLFNYIYADGAEKALSVLKRIHIDLLFAQYSLPKNNALLLVSAIRSYRRYNNLRVYLYGDHVTDEESKMAKRLGATGCFEKTLDNPTLIRRLKAILSPELLPGYVFFGNNETSRFMLTGEETMKPPSGPADGVEPGKVSDMHWSAGNDNRLLLRG